MYIKTVNIKKDEKNKKYSNFDFITKIMPTIAEKMIGNPKYFINCKKALKPEQPHPLELEISVYLINTFMQQGEIIKATIAPKMAIILMDLGLNTENGLK